MRILLITILLFLPLTAIAEDEVVLPFDYFYGRWVEGHYFDGFLVNSDLSDGDHGGNYSYTNSFMKFDIVNLQDYLLFSSRDDSIITPLYSIAFRPTGNWQVSLETVSYNKSKYVEEYHSEAGKFESNRYSYSGNIYSRWQNREEIRIRKEHAPYSYYLKPFLSRGNAIITSRFLLNNRFFKSELFGDGKDEPNSMIVTDFLLESKNDLNRKYIVFDNEVTLGLANNLNLNLQLKYSRNSIAEYAEVNSFDDGIFISRLTSHYKTYDDIYWGRLLFKKYFKGIYLSAGIGGSNNISEWKSIDYHSNADSVWDVSADQVIDYYVREDFIKYDLALEYLSNGSFEPEIMLDDYNNRYHQLLTNRQFLFQLKAAKTDNTAAKYPLDYDYNFSLLTKYGLYDYSELMFRANYIFINRDYVDHYSTYKRYLEILDYSFGLRLRTYLYDKNRKDWSKDTDADIMFGQMPEGSEIYFSLEFSPKKYHSTVWHPINLFHLSDLESYGESVLRYQLSAGFGRDFSLQFNYNEDYTGELNLWPYSVTFSKRVKEQFQFRIHATFEKFDWFDTDIIELFGGVEVIF